MYLVANTIERGRVLSGPIAKFCLESILPILNVKKTYSYIKYVYTYGLNTNLITVDDYVEKIKK